MLKITRSPDKPALSKNDGSRSAFNRNNNNRPASRRNNGDNKIDGFGIGRNSVEHAKKSGKTSKSQK